MMVEILRFISNKPAIAGVIAMFLIFLALLLTQPSQRRFYQWEIETQRLLDTSSQFSGLVQPRKRSEH